ncbi:hypothetical protein M0R19_03260 [Candidatus Pacearchaeota archaeon]|jgi:archaellum component FlaC|nr:hypothetical protein [Candidatus Pacearchaeota archaeon]
MKNIYEIVDEYEKKSEKELVEELKQKINFLEESIRQLKDDYHYVTNDILNKLIDVKYDIENTIEDIEEITDSYKP